MEAAEKRPVSNIIVTGITGSGKTALAWQLAKILNMGFLDLDAFIEKDTGQSIAELFSEFGESGFRQIEGDMIKRLSTIKSHVIAAGGGALTSDENLQRAQKIGTTVWVKAPIKNIATHLAMKPSEIEKRPLIKEAISIESKDERIDFIYKKLNSIQEERQKYYEKSDIVYLSDFSTPELSAQRIKYQLSQSGFLV